jgi:hypothetical protein
MTTSRSGIIGRARASDFSRPENRDELIRFPLITEVSSQNCPESGLASL